MPSTVLVAGAIATLVAFVLLAYRRQWQWTGLPAAAAEDGASPARTARTLWDWLQLLGVPLALATLAFILNDQQNRRDRRDEAQRATQQRLVAVDAAREETLRTYLAQMSGFMLGHQLLRSGPHADVREVARTATLTALRRLDGSRRGLVLRFLQEASLLRRGRYGSAPVDVAAAAFSAAQLAHANLDDALLDGAILVAVNLSGATLHGARLTQADLTRANLRSAVLIGTVLDGAKLRGADLRHAHMGGRDPGHHDRLSGASAAFAGPGSQTILRVADLRGANLREADLVGADLSGADLRGADLRLANLSMANLLRADLRGADLRGAALKSSNLREADLRGTRGVEGARSRDTPYAGSARRP